MPRCVQTAEAPTEDHFLMVSSDSEDIYDRRISAFAITAYRLGKGLWPIYNGTRYRKHLSSGARLLFYIGGSREYSGLVVARANIVEVINKTMLVDHEDFLTAPAFQVLRLVDVDMLEPKIKLKSLIAQLTFINPGPKWGAALMGGVRKVTKDDYNYLSGVKNA